jgi:hypothetical protein
MTGLLFAVYDSTGFLDKQIRATSLDTSPSEQLSIPPPAVLTAITALVTAASLNDCDFLPVIIQHSYSVHILLLFKAR